MEFAALKLGVLTFRVFKFKGLKVVARRGVTSLFGNVVDGAPDAFIMLVVDSSKLLRGRPFGK